MQKLIELLKFWWHYATIHMVAHVYFIKKIFFKIQQIKKSLFF